jgi:hypothetical protein
MAGERVSVRLAAVGGRQVCAELEGVGEAGSRGFGRLSRSMEAANAGLAAFSRRVRVASAAAVAAAAAAGVAMIRSGLQTVDAQAKLARRSAPRSPRSRRSSARVNWRAFPCPASSRPTRI